ncbi:interleukin-12 receptor subunit beta-2-like [Sinocyclocheilus anshuiensis]|uniref:interleukin-12 receptor subunit beta-2-like n=1 Tax=Sinocyclocheilus anshuiensis TaxID=1608454 RepID=UPI0007B7BE65|nr:PREDICTED: interleukin-12 receptor subunit beta-2-like [Sinocyclocheilus anshuiensis]
MSSECTWSVLLMLCFILTTGAHGGTVCTVKSSKGEKVLLGSDFTFSCIFNKQCTKLMFRNRTLIKYKQFPNSSEVSVDVENLTEPSTFSCNCKEPRSEPCGIDIKPGYPPDVPQNLTCVQKMKSGNISCIWTTGRGTIINTTCQLRVRDDLHLGYESTMNSTGFCHSTFPIKNSIMSQLFVSLNVSNSLGSKTSGPHTIILSNIVKPSMPEIVNVSCSSRWCILHTDNHSLNVVEIQYSAANGIWNTLQTNAKSRLNISSLQPYTTYKFQIRRKINHRVGLWSDCSQPKAAKTKEEAPDKVLDVWYLQELKPPQSNSECFHIFWKELNLSDAKGKILRYNISVREQTRMRNPIIAVPPSRNERICCSHCSVSVSAINSVGQSPVTFIHLHFPGLVSGFLSHRPLNNHSVALFWHKLAIASTEYVVHWYPVGNIEAIQWIRVVDTTAHITGLQPQECYDGAVTALQSPGPKMASIKGISTWQSAPEQGPVPQLCSKNSESLNVTWSEIPQRKRRGCLKKYTVYLMDKGDIHNFSVDHPNRQYVISGLSPGQCYNLWVTAWTDAGEGPKGSDLPFCTPSYSERMLSLVILTGGVVLLGCLILLCLCQFTSVQKIFLCCCQCLLPIIPDPANSKCAKTYTDDDQSEIKFYLDQCYSSVNEEPDNVEVEEVPYPSICTYIKSFSQESSSSDATQITRITDMTEDYISTHGAISGGEEEDEEETGLDEFEFFPSTHIPFLEPLVLTGGKLTLDAVKIDCSEFLDCT